MKKVFEPVQIGNLKLKNRLVRSATWEGIADQDGNISDNTYEIYSELSKGGVGMIITGFTSVMAEDHYFGGMMRLYDDRLTPQYIACGWLTFTEARNRSLSSVRCPAQKLMAAEYRL